jgi:Lantibiotic dehydratase, N terminus
MPGVGPDRVIPLSELVVGIRAGSFYVRWPRSGAGVIGCAGHMLNNMAAPDACRFLENILRLAQISGFDWGPASALPVLPRVQSGRIVLSLARCDAAAPRRRHPAAPRANGSCRRESLVPLSEAGPAACCPAPSPRVIRYAGGEVRRVAGLLAGPGVRAPHAPPGRRPGRTERPQVRPAPHEVCQTVTQAVAAQLP